MFVTDIDRFQDLPRYDLHNDLFIKPLVLTSRITLFKNWKFEEVQNLVQQNSVILDLMLSKFWDVFLEEFAWENFWTLDHDWEVDQDVAV